MKYEPGKRLGCIDPMQIYWFQKNPGKKENIILQLNLKICTSTSTVLSQEKQQNNSTIKDAFLYKLTKCQQYNNYCTIISKQFNSQD